MHFKVAADLPMPAQGATACGAVDPADATIPAHVAPSPPQVPPAIPLSPPHTLHGIDQSFGKPARTHGAGAVLGLRQTRSECHLCMQ